MNPNELKCIWMTAGVVSYKLCDQNFICDEFNYDKMMRDTTKMQLNYPNGDVESRFDEESENYSDIAKKLINKLFTKDFDASLHYSQNHMCLCKNEDGTVSIGIDPIIAHLLSYIHSIVLVSAGDFVRSSQIFGWIIQDGRTHALYSPINGIIRQHNPVVIDSPDYIRLNNLSKAWLIRLKILDDEFDFKNLMNGEVAKKWHKKEIENIKRKILGIVDRQYPLKSQTQFNGGRFITSVADIIPNEDYFKIIKSLLLPA